MRHFQILLALALLVFAGPASSPAAGAGTPEICDAAPEFSVPDKKLEHLAEAVAGHGTIDVLAVGSGTTVGQDGGVLGIGQVQVAIDDALGGRRRGFRMGGNGGEGQNGSSGEGAKHGGSPLTAAVKASHPEHSQPFA